MSSVNSRKSNVSRKRYFFWELKFHFRATMVPNDFVHNRSPEVILQFHEKVFLGNGFPGKHSTHSDKQKLIDAHE